MILIKQHHSDLLILIRWCWLPLIDSVHTFKEYKTTKLIAIHFWLLLAGQQNKKGVVVRPSPPHAMTKSTINTKYYKYCLWLYPLVGQVSWPNDLQFKRHTQKYNLTQVLKLIMTPQFSKLIWSTLKYKNYSQKCLKH